MIWNLGDKVRVIHGGKPGNVQTGWQGTVCTFPGTDVYKDSGNKDRDELDYWVEWNNGAKGAWMWHDNLSRN